MNTTPITNDRITLMTHDGLSLLLRRTFRRLSEVTRMHHNKMMEATEEDYEAMFRNPDIAPATLVQLDELMASLTDARAELLEIEDYWNSLPWSGMFSHPDPRVPQGDGEQCDHCRGVFMADALRDALLKNGESLAAGAGYAGEQRTAGATLGGAAGAALGGFGVGRSFGEARTGVGGLEAEMSESDALDLAQAVERQRVHLEEQREVYVRPGNVVVGPPSPDFEPALLAAKRVHKVNINSDVRTKMTVGKADVEHQVGGPPVIWLEAADGTRVAVIKEDVAKLAEVFAKMA